MLLSKIVMEASRDLLVEFLLCIEDNSPRVLSIEELEPTFDCYNELNFPNLRNKVTMFKYLWRFGIMDGITKLRGLSNWVFVQWDMFPGQGNDSNKVFIFKMSKIGPCSGVNLVTRMQLIGGLKLALMMSDYVKRVSGWTTMAYHVYDSTYQ